MSNKVIRELRVFREREGRKRGLGRALTFAEAADLVVVGGQAVNKTSWHAWENGRKVPAPRYMPALCDLVGASSDIFYHRRSPAQPKTAAVEQLSLV